MTCFALTAIALLSLATKAVADRPNSRSILADDLGFTIATPHEGGQP